MSVRTTADGHIAAAKEKLQGAIRDITEVAIIGCWGSDQYNSNYHDTLLMILHELVKAKKKL